MELQTALETTKQRLDEMVAKYNIKAIYALFSGGDDSTIMSYLASHHPLFEGVVFANTLTGDKETIDYVRNTAKLMNWGLNEVIPGVRDRYPAFIATYGIPTPAKHSEVYGNLKGKPFDDFATKQAKKMKVKRSQILFVSGIRRAESTRRMLTVQLIKEVPKNKGKSLWSVWGAPIFDWERSDLEAVFEAGVIQRNEHAFLFGASRECGCKSTEGTQDPVIEKKHHPIAWERRRLQYALAQAAYALQEFEVENGLIDRNDTTIPRFGVRQLENQLELFPYRYEEYAGDTVANTPYLCASCENQIGDDPDKEVLVDMRMKNKTEAA